MVKIKYRLRHILAKLVYRGFQEIVFSFKIMYNLMILIIKRYFKVHVASKQDKVPKECCCFAQGNNYHAIYITFCRICVPV